MRDNKETYSLEQFTDTHYSYTFENLNSIYILLIFQCQEYTIHYFNLLLGLFYLTNRSDFFKENKNLFNEKNLFNIIDKLYRDREKADLINRTHQSCFTEDEIKEIDAAIEENELTGTQIVEKRLSFFSTEEQLLSLTSLQAFQFYILGQILFHLDYPGSKIRLRHLTPNSKTEKQLIYENLTKQEQQAILDLGHKFDSFTEDVDINKATTLVNALDVFPRSWNYLEFILRALSLSGAFIWFFSVGSQKGFFEPQNKIVNTEKMTNKRQIWDINESLYVTQKSLVDYKETQLTHDNSWTDFPSFSNIQFSDFKVEKFRTIPKYLLKKHNRLTYNKNQEIAALRVKDQLQPTIQKLNFARLIAASKLNSLTENQFSDLTIDDPISIEEDDVVCTENEVLIQTDDDNSIAIDKDNLVRTEYEALLQTEDDDPVHTKTEVDKDFEQTIKDLESDIENQIYLNLVENLSFKELLNCTKINNLNLNQFYIQNNNKIYRLDLSNTNQLLDVYNRIQVIYRKKINQFFTSNQLEKEFNTQINNSFPSLHEFYSKYYIPTTEFLQTKLPYIYLLSNNTEKEKRIIYENKSKLLYKKELIEMDLNPLFNTLYLANLNENSLNVNNNLQTKSLIGKQVISNQYNFSISKTESLQTLLINALYTERSDNVSKLIFKINDYYELLQTPSLKFKPNFQHYQNYADIDYLELGNAFYRLERQFKKPKCLGNRWKKDKEFTLQIPRYLKKIYSLTKDYIVGYDTSPINSFIVSKRSKYSSIQKGILKTSLDRYSFILSRKNLIDLIIQKNIEKKNLRNYNSYSNSINFLNWIDKSSKINVFHPVISTGFSVYIKTSTSKFNIKKANSFEYTKLYYQNNLTPELLWTETDFINYSVKHTNRLLNKNKQLDVHTKLTKSDEEIFDHIQPVKDFLTKDPITTFPFIDNYLNEINEIAFENEFPSSLIGHVPPDPYKSGRLRTSWDVPKHFITNSYPFSFPLVQPYSTLYSKSYTLRDWRTKIISKDFDAYKSIFTKIYKNVITQVYRLPFLSRFGKYDRSIRFKNNEQIYTYEFNDLLQTGYFLDILEERKHLNWWDKEILGMDKDLYPQLFHAARQHFLLGKPFKSEENTQRVVEYGFWFENEPKITKVKSLQKVQELIGRDRPIMPLTAKTFTKRFDIVNKPLRNSQTLIGVPTESYRYDPGSYYSPIKLYQNQPSAVPLWTRTDESKLGQVINAYELSYNDRPPVKVAKGFDLLAKTKGVKSIIHSWFDGDTRELNFGRDYWFDWATIFAENVDEFIARWEEWRDKQTIGVNTGIFALSRLLFRPIAIEYHFHPIVIFSWTLQLFILAGVYSLLTISLFYLFSPDLTKNEIQRNKVDYDHPYFGFEFERFRKTIITSNLYSKVYPTTIKINFLNPQDNETYLADVKDTVDRYSDILEDIVQFFEEKYDFFNDIIPVEKSFFFIGRKGTGKFSAAKAIAKEANVPLFYVNAEDITHTPGFLTSQSVRYVFEIAELQSPCILYIEDIDKLGIARAFAHQQVSTEVINSPKSDSQWDQVIKSDPNFTTERAYVGQPVTDFQFVKKNSAKQDKVVITLLVEFDLLYKYNYSYIVIGSSTNPKEIDNALLRPGRLGKILSFGLLTFHGRAGTISAYANGYFYDWDIDWYRFIAETSGHFRNEIAVLCEESLAKVEALKLTSHTQGTIDSSLLLETIETYFERNKKSEKQKAREYELGLDTYEQDQKVPDEFLNYFRPYIDEIPSQIIIDANKGKGIVEIRTILNAYYQASRFFIQKGTSDPIDSRSLRYLNLRIEETIDYLRVKNTFTPWGSNDFKVFLNYILYLISGIAGEWVYFKGRFPYGTSRLDIYTRERHEDFLIFEEFVREMYLNFDTLRENFNRNQPLFSNWGHNLPYYRAANRSKYYILGYRKVYDALNKSLAYREVYVNRSRLPSRKKSKPPEWQNIHRNQQGRTKKLWWQVKPKSDVRYWQSRFHHDPAIRLQFKETVREIWYPVRCLSFEYTNLIQTPFSEGHKEFSWYRDIKIQGLITTVGILQNVRPLIDCIAFELARKGFVSCNFAIDVINLHLSNNIKLNEEGLKPAIQNESLNESKTLKTNFGITFNKLPNSNKFNIQNVKRIYIKRRNCGYIVFSKTVGMGCCSFYNSYKLTKNGFCIY